MMDRTTTTRTTRRVTCRTTCRTTWALPSAVAAIVAATSFIYQPSQAQTTAPAAAKQTPAPAAANECLSRPGAAGPRGTHWYYRIERPSGRKCWYLGSADAKVRRAAATERKAIPTPSPRPQREETPRSERAAEPPALAASDIEVRERAATPALSDSATPNPAAANPVTANDTGANAASAPGLPTAWSASPGFPRSDERDATPPAADDSTDQAATTEAQNEMPAVWPALTQANAAQPFESTPGVASLVIFLAAAGAFVAIAFRAVLQLWSGWFAPRMRRPVVEPAAPVIRPRMPSRPSPERPAEGSIEAMTEPTVARLREIAARWDSPRHVPRAPRVAPYDEMPEADQEIPPPRRRSAVA